MNVSIRHFRVFLAVAETSSFTGAAQHIGLSQPAVTTTIHQLEQDLETALLVRTTRQVSLTEAGAAFVPTAKRLVEEFDNAVTEMKSNAPPGTSRIGIAVLPSLSVLLLPQIINALLSEATQIKVHVRDLNSSAVQRRVRSGEVDIGLGTIWSSDPSLCFEPLMSDRLGIVCSKLHPLAQSKEPVSWRRATDHMFLDLAADTGIRPLIGQIVSQSGVQPSTQMEFSNIHTLAAVLETAVGTTAMPYLTYRSLRNTTLDFLPMTDAPVARTLCAISRKDASPSNAALRLRDLLWVQLDQFLDRIPEVIDARQTPKMKNP